MTVGLASASAGYFYGSRATPSFISETTKLTTNLTTSGPTLPETSPAAPDPSEGDDSDDEAADGDLAAISAGFMAPCKLVALHIKHKYNLFIDDLAGSCGKD